MNSEYPEITLAYNTSLKSSSATGPAAEVLQPLTQTFFRSGSFRYEDPKVQSYHDRQICITRRPPLIARYNLSSSHRQRLEGNLKPRILRQILVRGLLQQGRGEIER